MLQIDIKLIIEIGERRTSSAVCERITGLKYETLFNTMEGNAVIKPAVGEFNDSACRSRNFVFKQLEIHVAEVGVQFPTSIPGQDRGANQARVAG